jgi:hypothetical protein
MVVMIDIVMGPIVHDDLFFMHVASLNCCHVGQRRDRKQ